MATQNNGGKIEIKKTMGFFGAVSTMVGNMIGSGIFIAPQGVLIYTGSLALNLIIWAICGLISLGGALCYAELGTLIPESGGQWAYLRIGIGNVPAFLAAFSGIIMLPVGAALQSVAAAKYLLSPLFGACGVPDTISKIGGIILLWFCLYLNTSVKTTSKILKVLFLVKVASLIMVVAGGVYWMITHGTEKLQDPFKGTTQDYFGIATSFYFGLFSYSGWAVANNVSEEIKDISKTLPRAIAFSVVFMTGLYLFVLQSDAVVLDWGRPIVGVWAAAFSFAAGLSILGSLLVGFFTASRVVMALAREGHMFQAFALVNVHDNAPTVTFIFYGIVAPVAAIVGDILSLIQFGGFLSWVFRVGVFIALIRLKLTNFRADKKGVFRVPIILPVIMLLLSAYLVVVPVVANPGWEYLYASLIVLSGLLLYFPFMYCKVNVRLYNKFITLLQIIFRVGIPEKKA